VTRKASRDESGTRECWEGCDVVQLLEVERFVTRSGVLPVDKLKVADQLASSSSPTANNESFTTLRYAHNSTSPDRSHSRAHTCTRFPLHHQPSHKPLVA